MRQAHSGLGQFNLSKPVFHKMGHISVSKGNNKGLNGSCRQTTGLKIESELLVYVNFYLYPTS